MKTYTWVVDGAHGKYSLAQIAAAENIEYATLAARLRRLNSDSIAECVAAVHEREYRRSVRESLADYAQENGVSLTTLRSIFSSSGCKLSAAEVISRFDVQTTVANSKNQSNLVAWFPKEKRLRGRKRAAVEYVNRVGITQLMTLSEIAKYEGVNASGLSKRIESGQFGSLKETVDYVVASTESSKLTKALKLLGIERRLYDRYVRDFGEILGYNDLVEKIQIDMAASKPKVAARNRGLTNNITINKLGSISGMCPSKLYSADRNGYDPEKVLGRVVSGDELVSILGYSLAPLEISRLMDDSSCLRGLPRPLKAEDVIAAMDISESEFQIRVNESSKRWDIPPQRSLRSRVRPYVIDGQSFSASDLAKIAGCSQGTIRKRAKESEVFSIEHVCKMRHDEFWERHAKDIEDESNLERRRGLDPVLNEIEASIVALVKLKKRYDYLGYLVGEIDSSTAIPKELLKLPLKANLPFCQLCHTAPEVQHRGSTSSYICQSCGLEGGYESNTRGMYIGWIEVNLSCTSVTDVFPSITHAYVKEYESNGDKWAHLVKLMVRRFAALSEQAKIEEEVFEHPFNQRRSAGFLSNRKSDSRHDYMFRMLVAAMKGAAPPRIFSEGVYVRLSNRKFA